MKLKVVDAKCHGGLEKALGVSEEKMSIISYKMDEMVKDFIERGSKGESIFSSETFSYIASICDNLEEYTVAVLSHTSFMKLAYDLDYCPVKIIKDGDKQSNTKNT